MIRYTLISLFLIGLGFILFFLLKGWGLLLLVIVTTKIQAYEARDSKKVRQGSDLLHLILFVAVSYSLYFGIASFDKNRYFRPMLDFSHQHSKIQTATDQLYAVEKKPTPKRSSTTDPEITAPRRIALGVKSDFQRFYALNASFHLGWLFFIIWFVLWRSYRTASQRNYSRILTSTFEDDPDMSSADIKRASKVLTRAFGVLVLAYGIAFVWSTAISAPNWTLMGQIRDAYWSQPYFWVALNSFTLWLLSRFLFMKFEKRN